MPPNWLATTRTSYDTVASASAYADHVRDALATRPQLRAALSSFAEGIHAGPVADVGCGPGHVTAHLHTLGLNVFGLDLSPEMIKVARRDHPTLPFAVASMTTLPIASSSLAGVLAWWSLIHIPTDLIPGVLAHFHRVLRPNGLLLIGFHTGTGSHLKTEGYGGHPMHVHVHHRQPTEMALWLTNATFTIKSQTLFNPKTPTPGALLLARK